QVGEDGVRPQTGIASQVSIERRAGNAIKHAINEARRHDEAGRREPRWNRGIATRRGLSLAGLHGAISVGAEIEVLVGAHQDIEWAARADLDDRCNRPIAQEFRPGSLRANLPALVNTAKHEAMALIEG